MRKWVYTFGNGQSEGSAGERDILGSKGANLAEMASLGLPVPPGATIISPACTWYAEHQRHFPESLPKQIDQAVAEIERMSGRTFGGVKKPLFLAVRPGSRVPIPGMIEAILNLGLNDQTVEALAKETGDRRFAYDCYRRFISSFGDAVMGLDRGYFEDLTEAEMRARGVGLDTDLDADALVDIVAAMKELIFEEMSEAFPQDPREQLWATISATYQAWLAPRASAYRAMHGIPVEWGTALNLQAMVFGNRNAASASGIVLTRNPETGEKVLCGDYLPNSQGSELALGERKLYPVSGRAHANGNAGVTSMEVRFPEAYAQLRDVGAKLEAHYRDMQDIEFAVKREENKEIKKK